MQDLGPVFAADGRVADKRYSLRAGIVRVVYREHDPLDTELGNAAGERRLLKAAARREIEMLAEDSRETRPSPDMPEQPVAAPERERDGLAKMAKDDFQPRIGIEHAAHDEADGLERGLGR